MSDRDHPGNDRTKGAAKIPGKEPLRGPLRKRFYKEVSVAAADGGFALQLDGRGVKTPKKRPLVLPTERLAGAVAAEWVAQRNVIDPATMPLTRMANSAIDAVAENIDAVAADIAAFAASDLVCYRAEMPEELARRQAAAWDPVLEWAERELGTRFRLAAGVMPVEQAPSVRTRVLQALAGADGFRLAGLHVMTTLTGSTLLALAHAQGYLSLDATWTAAHIDEDWQIEQWGEDAEASARRAFRRGEFAAASRLLELLGPDSR